MKNKKYNAAIYIMLLVIVLLVAFLIGYIFLRKNDKKINFDYNENTRIINIEDNNKEKVDKKGGKLSFLKKIFQNKLKKNIDNNFRVKPGEEADSNFRIKAGEEADSNFRAKVGEETDSNFRAKVGEETDSNFRIKAGEETDSNFRIKAGEETDSNFRIKAGEEADSNFRIKAGEEADSNFRIKAGEEADSNFRIKPGQKADSNFRIPPKGEAVIVDKNYPTISPFKNPENYRIIVKRIDENGGILNEKTYNYLDPNYTYEVKNNFKIQGYDLIDKPIKNINFIKNKFEKEVIFRYKKKLNNNSVTIKYLLKDTNKEISKGRIETVSNGINKITSREIDGYKLQDEAIKYVKVNNENKIKEVIFNYVRGNSSKR